MASHEEALIRRPDFKISASIPSPLTVPIPCHHIRLGDILILGGRPCQVIRISTSAANGQHRYLGVDLFTKQLHEESSFVSNPAPSVVVQTMLGPVFKQYRVLDMQDGAIVALTETGDVKQNLPVIDQSSLWNRLQKAFESGRGSVRVLVVTDHGREMAVDMKVVHTSRLFGSRTTHDEHQKKPDVHEASRNGDSSLLRDILRDAPESITLLDTNKRTALFKAIEGRQRESAEILIDAGIDINALDENNISALEFALFNKDSTSQSMALLLLKGGASPVSNLESNGLALLSASAKGDMDTVNRLLANGTSINGQDRLGYTALHEAACFGNLEVAKKLIECGADVNAKTTLGGNTVLHVTIATSSDQQHRLFYEEESGRQKPPQLCSGHVDVVKLLLQYGAVPGLKRLDGLTVQGLLAQQLSALSADDQAQVFLQKILIVVNNPPSAESRTIVEKTYVPPTIPDAAWEVCNEFNIRIQYHLPGVSLPREFAVGNFIYRVSDAMEKKRAADLENWAKERASGNAGAVPTKYWRWIHLPANNKSWARDILHALTNKSGIKFDKDMTQIEAFIDESYHEVRGSAPHARLRRPLFTSSFGSQSENISFVLPYFDTENIHQYLNRSDKPNANHRRMQQLKKEYHQGGSTTKDLHLPCTLDQSYYLSLLDSTERDKTQVVLKHFQRQHCEITGSSVAHSASGTEDNRHQKNNLVMVKQLWLWKIDADTFITAFPDRCNDNDKPDLLAYISQVMGQNHPPSLESMIIQLLQLAVGFVDAPNNAGLDENLFDIFEQSIAYRAHGESECYNAFYKARKDVRIRYTDASEATAQLLNQNRMLEEEKMCDITQEIEHLREIKDIRDELKMIERVLEDQMTVITQYNKSREDLPAEGFNKLTPLMQSLDFRLSKVRRLTKDAEVVESSLNHLLDLKQKQGNLNEARDSRRLADEADRRGRASEKQNQLLFVFTVVTIVFTPISFVSTLLAVPSIDFPRTEDGHDVGWSWWQVVAGSLVTEIVTFFAIATWWFGATRKSSSAIASTWVARTLRERWRRLKDWWAKIYGSGEWKTVAETRPGGEVDEEKEAEVGQPGV